MHFGSNFSPQTGCDEDFSDKFVLHTAGASTLLGVAKHFTFVENTGGLGTKSSAPAKSATA